MVTSWPPIPPGRPTRWSIHGPEPQVVSLLDLAQLDVEEGTPVVDAAGELVGLCTGSYDGTTLMTVDTMPGDDATAAPGADTTTAVETTGPPTTTATTIVESTTVESTIPGSSEPTSSVEQSTTVETTTPESAPSTAPDATAGESIGPAYPPGR